MDYFRPSSYKEAHLPQSALDLLIEYTKDFLRERRAKLDSYQELLRECQEHFPELAPREDRYLQELRDTISQAEQLVSEVEQLRKDTDDEALRDTLAKPDDEPRPARSPVQRWIRKVKRAIASWLLKEDEA
jgi:hypothetical protein